MHQRVGYRTIVALDKGGGGKEVKKIFSSKFRSSERCRSILANSINGFFPEFVSLEFVFPEVVSLKLVFQRYKNLSSIRQM